MFMQHLPTCNIQNKCKCKENVHIDIEDKRNTLKTLRVISIKLPLQYQCFIKQSWQGEGHTG